LALVTPTAFGRAVVPGDVVRLVAERGHESLFFPEHTHIPTSRESGWPGGADLPRKYWHTYDPFVAATAAAAANTRLRVGTGICLVVERDPITTAKEVASVDNLSGGRFEFGVGAGWNREEMVNHGTDPRRRMALMAERIEAMKAIWTEDEASYMGEFVEFEGIWSWPKPSCRIRRFLSAATAPASSTASFASATPGCRPRAARTSRDGQPSCVPALSARSTCR
jgi:probable F420-dependent oxidoreductase